MKLEEPPGLDPDCRLFLGDPDNKSMSLFGRVWSPAGGAFMGCAIVAAANMWYRRPVISGLHKYLIMGVAGGLTGEGLFRLKKRIYSEKDLQYYHYMTLHPEDFQAPERVKYKDYLTLWVPIR